MRRSNLLHSVNDGKCIGVDVHQATTSAAVLDFAGKLVMEAILETNAETILQFVRGLRGSLHVTFEKGTWAGSPMSRVCWSLIHARTTWEKMATGMITTTPALAELLYRNKVKSSYDGEHGRALAHWKPYRFVGAVMVETMFHLFGISVSEVCLSRHIHRIEVRC